MKSNERHFALCSMKSDIISERKNDRCKREVK
jgi:hypothetical protein